jgi:hypothetical protein
MIELAGLCFSAWCVSSAQYALKRRLHVRKKLLRDNSQGAVKNHSVVIAAFKHGIMSRWNATVDNVFDNSPGGDIFACIFFS